MSGLSGAAAQCNGTNNAGDPLVGATSMDMVGTGTFGSTTIPANAYALVVDLTVVSNTTVTYLVAYKYGTTRPYPVVSLEDWTANHPANSQVTVPLGANGTAGGFSLFNYGGTTNVAVDVVGYYLPPASGTGFNILAGGPTRVCDTRPSNPSSLSGSQAQCNGTSNAGKTLGTSLNGNSETLAVQVTGLKNTGGQPISPPAGATAVVFDLSAQNASIGTYLTAYAAGTTNPKTMSLEVPNSNAYNAEVTVPLSPSGVVDITNFQGSINVQMDVEGYFVPGSGDQYMPITAERICDTRAGNVSGLTGSAAQCNGANNSGDTIPAGKPLTMDVTALSSGIATAIPANATAVVATITALNQSTSGWALAYPAGTTPSAHATSLDYYTNTPVSDQVTVALGANGQLSIESTASIDVAVDIQGYYQAIPQAGGPTATGEMTGGSNPSDSDVTQPSTPAGDPAAHAAVDDATGELDVNVTDDHIPGNGIPLDLTRTYASGSAATLGAFGYGWADSYHMTVTPDPTLGSNVMDVTQENGSVIQFGLTNSGTWTPPTRTNATLTKNTSTGIWTFTRDGQNTYTFNSAGRLQSEADADGYTIVLGPSSGQLSSVTAEMELPGSANYGQDLNALDFTWGPCGASQCVTSVRDSAGRAISYTYDATGNLTGVQDVGGAWTYYSYDTNHRLITIKDADGNTTTWAYNRAGQIGTETDSLAHQTSWTYSLDSNGNGTTTVTDPMSYQTQYTFATGLLTSQTQAAGTPYAETTTYTYDAVTDGVAKQITAAGTPYAETTNTAYNEGDPDSSPTDIFSQTDGDQVTSTTTYSAQNQPVDVTSAAGTNQSETTLNNYSSSSPGDLTQTQVPDPDGSGTLETNLSYNPAQPGDPTAATSDERTSGGTTSTQSTAYTYDNYGRTASTTDPDGNTTTYGYNSLGEKTSMVSPRGNVTGADPTAFTTSYTYDPYGNLTQTTNPAGDTTKATYDPDGNKLTSTDADGDITTNTYNGDGQVTQTSQPDGTTISYAYDPDGKTLTQTDADGQSTTYTYDPNGNKLTETDPLGHTTVDTYDPNGNKLTETDPDDNTTTYIYDGDNHLLSTTQPDGTVLTSTYDPNGNQDSYLDANNNKTTYKYNSLNQLVSTTDPLNHTTSYTYDANGNKVTDTNPDGQTATWSYNADNQTTGITYTDGTHSVTYTYTPDGKVATMTDASGTTTYTYDNDDRLASYQNGEGATVSYTYDGDGNVTSVVYPNGKTVTETYNKTSRLASLTDWNNNTTSFSYDRDGNLTTTTYPNGTLDTRAYNNSDQIASITDSENSNTVLSFSYGHDLDGNITSETDAGTPNPGTTNYTYNKLNQLTAAGTNAYSYDRGSNLTSGPTGTTQEFNSDDQLCWSGTGTGSCSNQPAGATAYTYNNEGDRTTTTPSTGTADAYAWTQNNLLSRTTPSAGAPTSYTYDGNNLLQTETSNATATHYTWDTETAVPQLIGDSTNYYLYGPTPGPIEQISSGTGTVRYLLADQQGSVRATINAAGTVTGAYSYDPWGNQTGTSGDTTTPFGYSGEYLDNSTGFYYLQARWYDPKTGQFTTTDPMTVETNASYNYANNNPLDYADPTGEYPGLITNELCDLYRWSSWVCKDATRTHQDHDRVLYDRRWVPAFHGWSLIVGVGWSIPNWYESRRVLDSFALPNGVQIDAYSWQVRDNVTVCCSVSYVGWAWTWTEPWRVDYGHRPSNFLVFIRQWGRQISFWQGMLG